MLQINEISYFLTYGQIFFSALISSILDNYKSKHSNNKVHITFDHMFSHDNYTVFMFSMRIGTQGIPIYKAFNLSSLLTVGLHLLEY